MSKLPLVLTRVAACLESLERSVCEAGGSIELDRLLRMSVEEFILEVAGPNGIGFQFVPLTDSPLAGLRGFSPSPTSAEVACCKDCRHVSPNDGNPDCPFVCTHPMVVSMGRQYLTGREPCCDFLDRRDKSPDAVGPEVPDAGSVPGKKFLGEEAIRAIGWTWAEACAALDRGDDPRRMSAVPGGIKRAVAALGRVVEPPVVPGPPDPPRPEKPREVG